MKEVLFLLKMVYKRVGVWTSGTEPPRTMEPDITMYQGTGKITSSYRGIVKLGFRSIHFTVLNIGRAEKS